MPSQLSAKKMRTLLMCMGDLKTRGHLMGDESFFNIQVQGCTYFRDPSAVSGIMH